MNHDYSLTARHHNIVINTTSGDDLTDFPIEKARFRSIWYSIGASGACTTGYGWAIHSRAVRPYQIAKTVRNTWLRLMTSAHIYPPHPLVHHRLLHRPDIQRSYLSLRFVTPFSPPQASRLAPASSFPLNPFSPFLPPGPFVSPTPPPPFPQTSSPPLN